MSSIESFLDSFVKWARTEDRINAVALVGSYARGTAKIDSDVDLIIISEEPEIYLIDETWINKFGVVAKSSKEDFGLVQALRVFYNNNLEIEFGFTTMKWASTPVDEGTKKVISDGIKILYDKNNILHKLLQSI